MPILLTYETNIPRCYVERGAHLSLETKMTLDFSTLDLSTLAPARRAPDAGDHFVEFYDDDDGLVRLIGRFLSAGLHDGDAVVVVADGNHRRKIQDALESSGLDVAALEEGRYISLDAEDVLSRFMDEGAVDEARCIAELEGLLAEAARHGKNVRVFGEMVAVLWSQGNVAGAIALEGVWNRLSETRAFRLFCAYPAGEFRQDDLDAVREVCRRHSHVIPPP